jgi:hypothetical protein
MEEIWKTVLDFSLYEYSNLGNLRSKNYKNTGRVQILKPAVSTDGYLKTMLKDDNGKYVTIAVHRVIAKSHFGVQDKKLEVNHINGIKTDNRIENLEYITHSQNCKHSFDIGLQKPKRGELNGMAKLTQKDVDFLRSEKIKKGRYWGRKQYAKQFGITEKHLQQIVNTRENW